VSKRHQSNRRKSYGRRQHELAERRQNRDDPEVLDIEMGEALPARMSDRFVALDTGVPLLRYAMGD
jgi:hypothetical protein